MRLLLTPGAQTERRTRSSLFFSSAVVVAAAALFVGGFTGCIRGIRGDEPVRSVILIVLDAASVRHFGCYGYRQRTTPEIDRLAARGDVFLNAYSPAPYTRAAMMALWTSREPGARGAFVAPRLAERLSARGIHTAGFVGNPNVGPSYSFNRGFAEFHEAYPDTEGSQAELFRPLLERFLRENQDRRFFAWVHYREPHFPYDPPLAFAERFPLEKISRLAATDQRLLDAVCGRTGGPTDADRRDLARLYDANLAYVDAEVGWLWGKVVAAGLAETTAVVVTSDHGDALCEHGFVGHNLQVYDESVHVPLIVRRPGTYFPRRHDALVSLLDIAPTVMGLFGLDEGVAGFEGRDILAKAAPDDPPRVFFSRSTNNRPTLALRDEDHAFIYNTALDKAELFDRRRDPDELHDLSAAHPDLVRRYRAEVLAHAERLNGPIAPRASRKTRRLRERLEALGYLE